MRLHAPESAPERARVAGPHVPFRERVLASIPPTPGASAALT